MYMHDMCVCVHIYSAVFVALCYEDIILLGLWLCMVCLALLEGEKGKAKEEERK